MTNFMVNSWETGYNSMINVLYATIFYVCWCQIMDTKDVRASVAYRLSPFPSIL